MYSSYGSRASFLRQQEDTIAAGLAGLFTVSSMCRKSATIPPWLARKALWHGAGSDRKWITDFTYVWTAEGCLYVAAVIDLFARRVAGWSMNAAMTARLVTDTLVMAIWRGGKPDALLHHSDRGSQYSSEQFQRLMADHDVV